MNQTWREVTAQWQGGMSFVGKNRTGGSIKMGTIDEQSNVSPMELLLFSMFFVPMP